MISEYATDGLNCESYLTQNEDGTLFTVVDIENTTVTHEMDVSVVVHIIENYIVIEKDMNDKLVIDALLQAGIPRGQIILAYAGEPVPANV